MRLTIPLVFEELVGVFLLGLLQLQQREQPLLLLTRAIHEVVPRLYIVSIGADFIEDGWDGWVAANLQIVFGALIFLKEISKVAC